MTKICQKMKNIITLITITLLTGLLGSCNKEEGRGGTATVQGKVITIKLNKYDEPIGEPYDAMNKTVYIIYGNKDLTYSDKFSTSLDGSYRFDYLVPGEYTIFTYSKCKSCPDEKDVKQLTVEITKKGELVNLPDLIIYD